MRLSFCSASHFTHVSAYGYVSLTIKEDSFESLVRFRCLEVLAFRQFLKVLLVVYVRKSRGHAQLGLKLPPVHINVLIN